MQQAPQQNFDQASFSGQEKPKDVRRNNILSAKTLADIVRTSLGPRGMDKMIKDGKGNVTITNDGATIVNKLQILHPTAKMLVETSKAQDIAAGDGTTTVVILAGALLNQAQQLLDKNIGPTIISDGYSEALKEAEEIIDKVEKPVDLKDEEALVQNCITSLSSKVVASDSHILAPIAVKAVLSLVNAGALVNNEVDLRDIKVSKKLGGVIEDTELVNGLVFTHNKISKAAGGPTRIEKPKIGLIQFCISSPKTDMENSVVVQEYSQMDRVLKEERNYIVKIVKKIKETGCNVLLIQKSILRDAVNDLALHFLSKAKIMVIRDIEREDVEFIAKTIQATPVAHIDSFTPEKLGKAELCEEINVSEGSRLVKITGVPNGAKTVSILVRGSNKLLLDEAERSLHDALCVVRSIVKRKAMVPGGGACEMEIAMKMMERSHEIPGFKSYCYRAFAEALEVIPYTLSENAGLNPINMVTELRNKHMEGMTNAGINVKTGTISDMFEEKVIQPSLVTLSALKLATEVVRMILKIDDIVICR
ncbi:MAG: T-complex protein 1 subunit delta [archaeon]|nr:T-complex protein 1 subunit delta [archaeon]